MPMTQLEMDDAIMGGFARADQDARANDDAFTKDAKTAQLTAAWYALLKQVGQQMGGLPPEQVEAMLVAKNKAGYEAAKSKFLNGGANATPK